MCMSGNACMIDPVHYIHVSNVHPELDSSAV